MTNLIYGGLIADGRRRESFTHAGVCVVRQKIDEALLRYAQQQLDEHNVHCVRKGMTVRISNGGGWDHVSVSFKTRCPTWEEMCQVKSWCFEPEEAVMQLHPPESDYRNHHPFCLHLWRPQTDVEIAAIRSRWERDGEVWPYGDYQPPPIPLPPGSMVAPLQREKRSEVHPRV